MAAKLLESSNRVWQRAATLMTGARAESRAALQALKQYLATQGGNPPLQILTFSNVTTQQVTALNAGGGTVYAIFTKKQNTATPAYVKINDSATLAGGAAGINIKALIPLLVANQESILVFTPGMALTTGLVVASETTAAGGANSTSGDGPNGFAIIG